MEQLLFDKKVFNNGYAIHYTIMQMVFLGGIEEKYIYEIDKITSMTRMKRYYCIVGEIKLEIINKGRVLEGKKLQEIKIPNAYKGMEKLVC